MSDRNQAPGFDAPTDPAWLEHVTEVAARRAPSFLDMGLAHGWKGYYEITPDHNALVGRGAGARARSSMRPASPGTASCRRLPSVRSCATSILDREPFVDVSPLAAERFALDAPRPEHNVI